VAVLVVAAVAVAVSVGGQGAPARHRQHVIAGKMDVIKAM
jgi:hypothetical protein